MTGSWLGQELASTRWWRGGTTIGGPYGAHPGRCSDSVEGPSGCCAHSYSLLHLRCFTPPKCKLFGITMEIY